MNFKFNNFLGIIVDKFSFFTSTPRRTIWVIAESIQLAKSLTDIFPHPFLICDKIFDYWNLQKV